MRGWFAALVGASAFLTSPSVGADDVLLVRDGADFSVDVGPLAPCFIRPKELRREAACVGFDPDKTQLPADAPKQRLVAAAWIRVSNGSPVLMTIAHVGSSSTALLTDRDVATLFESIRAPYEQQIKQAFPQATVRLTHVHIASLKSRHTVGRGDLDVDGAPAAVKARAGHSAQLVVPVTNGGYGIALIGDEEAGAAMDAALESLLPSIVVAHPQGPDLGYELGQLIGKILGFVVIGGGVAAVATVVGRRRKRLAGEQSRELWPRP